MHRPAGQLTNRLDFAVLERPSVALQQVMEPHVRNRCVRVIPRVPGVVGLRLSRDESPIECTNLVALGNWQDVRNGAAQRPGQVLGAENRSVLRGELLDAVLEVRRLAVGVECEDVGVAERSQPLVGRQRARIVENDLVANEEV